MTEDEEFVMMNGMSKKEFDIMMDKQYGDMADFSLWKREKGVYIKIEGYSSNIWSTHNPSGILYHNEASPQKPDMVGTIGGKYAALWKGKTQYGNDKYMVMMSDDNNIYNLKKTVPVKQEGT